MTALPSSPLQRATGAIEKIWAHRGAASFALLPASWLFGAVTALRRRLHARGVLPAHRLPVPVVVVGNIVAGGAGKTPTVLAVVDLLHRHGFAPGIVSRGYGRADDELIATVTVDSDASRVGDEPLLLRRRSGVPVVVGRDRVAAAHALLQSEPHVDILVSDDGLQHLALERDVEVLVFDERGAGNGRLLPAGPLREPLQSGPMPDRLVLYNAERPTTALPGFMATRGLTGVTAIDAWWRGEPASMAALESLRGREVLAVCGLARPQRFSAMLRESGLTVTEMALEDHHSFATLPWPSTSADVVVTEKDAVKLPPARRMNTRVWVAALDFAPEPAFESALIALLASASVDALSESSLLPHGNPSA
ncbi:MAG: tetraacyldisaccharide 4'-kinase [Caldimonas sp.]